MNSYMYLRRAGAISCTFLSLLVLASCGLTDTPAADTDKAKFNKGKGKNSGPVPVVTVTAGLKDVPIEIQVVGNVEAYSIVSVRAQVSGQLTNVLLKDGDYVHKGDPLFAIDPRQVDGNILQAEANLARSTALLTQAEANLARDTAQATYSRGIAENYEQLQKDGIFSKDQARQTKANADALTQTLAADRAAIQSAQAQIAADKANINNLNIQKSYTNVPAPIEGRTGNVTQKLGNIVTANNTELAQIHQVEPIYVSFAVPEGRLNEIKDYFDKGGKLPVTTHAQDGSGKEEHGALSFIDNSVDTSTGTIRLKGTFPNSNHNLWPGQFVNVTLQLTTRHNAVVVPNQVVQTGQEGTFVYVVDENQKVSARPVKVGPRIDLDMVIDDGLKAGEVVVSEGQLRLQPGSTVQSAGGRGRGDAKGKDASKGGDAPQGTGNDGGFKGKGEFKKDGFKGKGKRGGPDGV
ncbi:MAG: efflux RND transporter periplasmic adaptor subunit [Acidobacteriota bacterium]